MACGCSLAWFRSWLQEASLLGPRCGDGSLLKERKLYRIECESEKFKEEPVLPGCENEIVQDVPMHGTSQVFSPWMEKIRDQSHPINQLGNAPMAPSPEESEYFYDEYVDYPYNETNLVELSNSSVRHYNTNRSQSLSSTPSYHFTPGDTPTIYAGANPNKTILPSVNYNTNPNPNDSSFTFFGMPIPTINIGKFWGNERKTERKASDGRNIQDFNLTKPDIQAGGFIPLTPGVSGGFTPISNTTLFQYDKEKVKPNNTYWPDDFPKHSKVDNTVKTIEPSLGIIGAVSDKGALFDSETSRSVNQSTYTRSAFNPDFDESAKVTYSQINAKHYDSEPTNNIISPVNDTYPLFEDDRKYENKSKIYISNSEETIHHPYVIPTPTVRDDIPIVTQSSLETIEKPFKYSDMNDLYLSTSSSTPSTRTAMTEEQHLAPMGRKSATITKVESPHSDSTPSSSSESYRTNNRGAKTSFYGDYDANVNMMNKPYNNSFSWYYKNYNESELEPYVGPGLTGLKSGSGQCNLKCDIYILGVTVLYFNVKYIISA